jgi:hypothetical protein
VIVTKASEIIEFLAELPARSIQEIEGVHDGTRSYSALGASPVVVAAHRLNLAMVAHKLRKDGTPYADHPVRVALLIDRWFGAVWQPAQVAIAKACGLVHDALEEGPGVSADSAVALRDALHAGIGDRNSANEIAFSAVVLTEPGLDYRRLVGIDDKATAKLLNKACLIHQICDWCSHNPESSRQIAAAAIADKWINLFDVGYILDSIKTAPQHREDAMASYLGSLGFALLEFQKCFSVIRDPSQALPAFLTQALAAMEIQIQAQAVGRDRFHAKVEQLRRLWSDNARVLQPLIRSRIGGLEAALRHR